jgi:hypothetical protein
MRRLLILLLAGLSTQVFAQVDDSQPAVRYLEEYVRMKENAGGDRTAAWATVISGGVVAAGGTVLYFTGDALSRRVSGEPWSRTTRYTVSGTMVGTGIVAAGVGGAMLVSSNADYRSRYQHIFTQPLPHLRERQAAEALHDLAQTAYRRRRLAGMVKIGIPILTVATTMSANALLPDRDWYQDVPTIAFGQVWSVISGISDLARRSREERLYDRYLAERRSGP